MQHIRNCPKCNSEITHVSEQRMLKSHALKRPCKKCALDATRAKTQSVEWRKEQSDRLKKAWSDPLSTLNGEEYRNRLSQGQIKRWENASPEQIAERHAYLKASWVGADSRREIFAATCKRPDVAEKRRVGMIKSWANDPERKRLQSERASERMKDPIYKEKCTRKLIEAATRTGGKSKAELVLAEALSPLGFISSHRIGKYYVDFFNPATNTIVEYFGDWWHCHPKHHDRINEKYQGRHPQGGYTIEEITTADNMRIEDLKTQGYSVVILWENDIKRGRRVNVEKAIDMINDSVK